MHDALSRFQKELRATFAGCLELVGGPGRSRGGVPMSSIDDTGSDVVVRLHLPHVAVRLH